MASDRPEHVKCIQHTHEEHKKRTWCGKRVAQWMFVFGDIDHAAYNAKNGGRSTPCPECLEQVRIALDPENVNGSPYV